MNKIDLLIELGFEEIPSSYLKPGIEMWLDNISKILKKNEMEYGKAQCFYTPRRYVIHIEGIEEDTSVKTIEITGPPETIAKVDGKWSKAAMGFAKSQGKSPDDIYFVAKGKNKICALKVERRKKGVEEILKENLSKTVESIRFPKTMIWENTKFRFARPIRWLLVLKNDSVIHGIELAGIGSSNFTFGNRAYGNKKINVNSIGDYFNSMESNRVITNQERRKEIILDNMKKLEEENDFGIVTDDELLEEINGMVEFPVVLLGQFHNQYTELPAKVVTTAMKQHQRYFSAVKNDGEIAPYFIFVANTDRNSSEIIKNNEKVLRSRLEDAYFYYEEDLKIPISERIEIQKEILWHHGLGTIYEKAVRVSEIAEHLTKLLGMETDGKRLKEVALHLKIDLSTDMIKDGKEFTKLEGYIGSVYAEKLGVDGEIAKIILEHNLPRFSKDILPRTDMGAVFALADRYDTVAGFTLKFGLPKGSKDPLGIRRTVNAIVEITVAKKWHYNFTEILAAAAKKFEGDYNPDKTYDFFMDRMINYAQNENIKYDIINAVSSLKLADLYDIILRARTLNGYRTNSENEFNSLVIGQKRVANILKSNEMDAKVNPSLFKEPQEKVLYDKCINLDKTIDKLLLKRDYSSILDEYFKVRPSIDKFFDDVLVMDNDTDLRKNRLALMRFLRGLFRKVADFSKIVIEGER